MSFTMAKGMTKMATSKSAIARLTKNMLESFLMIIEGLRGVWVPFEDSWGIGHLRLGSVVTARQTRELPKMEATTSKERSKHKLIANISPCEQKFWR